MTDLPYMVSMTVAVGIALSDCVLLFADQRRSGIIDGAHIRNVQKLHLFGSGAGVLQGGLSDITDETLATVRTQVSGDPNLDELISALLRVGSAVYDRLISNILRLSNGFNRAEFIVGGFTAAGCPGIAFIGLHEKKVVHYPPGTMSVSSSPGVANSDIENDIIAVLRNVGPVYGDELGSYVIGRAERRAPSEVGMPVDIALLTQRPPEIVTRVTQAPIDDVDGRFRLEPAGSSFSHQPVSKSASRIAPRAGALWQRPL